MKRIWMQQAIDLARNGWGRTSPNPLVGCVIVKNATVLATGYHAAAGLEHAERAAINQAVKKGSDLKGASLLVNLEPCAHHGRTPPCTDLIINSGISEVYIAMSDPNPRVAGRGIAALRQAGIKVHIGLLKQEAQVLNEPFCKYITSGLPFVIMKAAMSIDGKIADFKGRSRWISGEKSRQLVHHWRDRSGAIIVGSRTVLHDDPALTTRLADNRGKNPARIVVDRDGTVPLTSRVFNPESGNAPVIATTDSFPALKRDICSRKGIRVLNLDDGQGNVNLADLLEKLGEMEIDCVLLEGGGSLNASFLAAGLVDKLMLFMAPLLIGGNNAVSCYTGNRPNELQNALKIEKMQVTACGRDWLIEGYPQNAR